LVNSNKRFLKQFPLSAQRIFDRGTYFNRKGKMKKQ